MRNICEMYNLYLKKIVSILNDLLLVITEYTLQAARSLNRLSGIN